MFFRSGKKFSFDGKKFSRSSKKCSRSSKKFSRHSKKFSRHSKMFFSIIKKFSFDGKMFSRSSKQFSFNGKMFSNSIKKFSFDGKMFPAVVKSFPAIVKSNIIGLFLCDFPLCMYRRTTNDPGYGNSYFVSIVPFWCYAYHHHQGGEETSVKTSLIYHERLKAANER